MSTKSRNFRRRGAESNDDDSNDTPSTTATATTTTTTTKPPSSSAKPKKPPKLLSFADDEGDDTDAPPSRASAKPHRSSAASADKPSSRLGKPSSSHKITTLKDRIAHSSSPSVPSNVQPLAGTYTKEALRELQKNTRTLVSSSSTSSRPSASGSDPKPSSEPVVVLKGLVKPLGSETEARDSDSGGEQEEVEAKLASVGIAANGKDSVIPDEETIRAIRARRERLRQARPAAQDYISLDGGSNHGAAEGLSDEEPEFQGRIAMFGGRWG